MENLIKKLFVTALFIGFYGISAFGVAQTNEQNEKALKGKWILEKVSAFEENVQKIPFSVDSLGCEIPVEINIQQENITFVRKKHSDTAKYNFVVRGGILCFPICAEWKVVAKKLQLKWVQDVDSSPNGLTIVLTYKLK